MGVRALDHVNIATDRVEETRAFFVDVIGLTEGFRPQVSVPGYWLYAGERAVIHLQEKAGVANGAAPALDHFALELSDIDEMAGLRSLGVPFSEFGLPSAAIRQLVVRDPNGVKVELNWRGVAPAA